MKTITNKEYAEWERYKFEKSHGRILNPDALRMIIEANNYDAEKIGRHFLEMYPKIRVWTEEPTYTFTGKKVEILRYHDRKESIPHDNEQ